MIGFERLQTLKLVAELWQDPDAMAAIGEALEDAKAGRILKFKGEPKVREILKAARRRG
jgi:hypothetical protein